MIPEPTTTPAETLATATVPTPAAAPAEPPVVPVVDIRQAAEGLHRWAVTFQQAERVANTLEQFASLVDSVGSWQQRLGEVQANVDKTEAALADATTRFDAKVDEINQGAHRQRADLDDQIATAQAELAKVQGDVVAAKANLAAINEQIAQADALKANLLAALKA